MGFSSSGPVMNPGAGNYYNQEFAANLGNYNKITDAYTQAQQNASTQLEGIYSGYGALSKSVLDTLGVGGGGWGVAAPAAQQIQRQYTQSQGQNQQQLINSGLGNSTLLSNVMNQGTLQYGQAIGNLGAQLSQTAAGYQSQIGMAGLGARQQGLGQQLGLTSGLMGDLSHFNYAPHINLYGQQSMSDSGGGYGGGGGHGGTTGSASPGGAAGAVGAAGAYGFGQNGGGAMGYQGGFNYGGGYPPSQVGPQPQRQTMLNYDEGYGSMWNNPGLDYGNPNDFGGGGDF